MATTFIERFVPQILNYEEAEQLQNTTEGQELEKLIELLLIDEAVSHWNGEPQGVFPQELVDEMHVRIYLINIWFFFSLLFFCAQRGW